MDCVTLQKANLGHCPSHISYMLQLLYTPQSLGTYTRMQWYWTAQGLITCCFPFWHTQPGNAPHFLKGRNVIQTYNLSCVKHAQGVW